VLGFENLVFSIFEFVHTLLDNSKFKSTVKKALPELIYYVILYMQITEDQVRFENIVQCRAQKTGGEICPFPPNLSRHWTENGYV
jgi:hypothetical protein